MSFLKTVSLLATLCAVCSAQSSTTPMMMTSTGRMMMMSSSSTMSPMSSSMGSLNANTIGNGMYNNNTNSGGTPGDDDDDGSSPNMYTSGVSSMDAMNATAEICDDISDVLQAAMNATTFIFSNKEIQSFMAAQDGMDWLWRPSGSARWCQEACIAVNKTMCPTGRLDNPMMHSDMCRTCVLECLACTYEDNYWMTLRAYVMSLMAPLIQLVSSTMAVDMSDMTQAQLAQKAQQAMYDKFNAAVSPLANRMRLDRMYNLNCQMFANYQSPTDASSSTTMMPGMKSMDAPANAGRSMMMSSTTSRP